MYTQEISKQPNEKKKHGWKSKKKRFNVTDVKVGFEFITE